MFFLLYKQGKEPSPSFSFLLLLCFHILSICYFLAIEITQELVFLTFGVAVLAKAGDITESIFKRSINTKDSAKTIPGHGGFMDRFDGYLYVIPLFALSPAQGLFLQ